MPNKPRNRVMTESGILYQVHIGCKNNKNRRNLQIQLHIIGWRYEKKGKWHILALKAQLWNFWQLVNQHCASEQCRQSQTGQKVTSEEEVGYLGIRKPCFFILLSLLIHCFGHKQQFGQKRIKKEINDTQFVVLHTIPRKIRFSNSPPQNEYEKLL